MSGDRLLPNKLQEAILSELITGGNDSLNQLREGVLVINDDWNCLFVNNAAVNFCQSAREDLLNKSISVNYLMNRKGGAYSEIVNCRVTGNSQEFEKSFAKRYP